MPYLLDTHMLLWYISGNPRLSEKARAIIDEQSNIILISKATLWEIAIKCGVGKLEISIPFSDLEKYLASRDFKVVDFGFADLHQLTTLSLHHRDPFDRILICQSISANCTLLSDYPMFKLYPVQLLS